ncbi:hypothetical protein C8F01DRAFT_1167052 [Mycena amicta]|nr:hypothetical protein C8F01DRAFT_1167052 [Mycena amicta]
MFLATAIVVSVYAGTVLRPRAVDESLQSNRNLDNATQIAIGLALPPNGALSADFLAQLSVPIPYGFAGFGPADGSNTVVPHLPRDTIGPASKGS